MEFLPMPHWETLGRMLADIAGRHADLVAVIDGDRSLTYGELHRKVRMLAKALIAAGLQKDDLVTCWAPNSWRWVVLAHAVWLAGGVMVPISSRLKLFEAGPLLEKTQAKFLFTVGACVGQHFIDELEKAYGPASGGAPFAKLPSLRRLVRLDVDCTTGGKGEGFADFSDHGLGVSDENLDARARLIQAGDVCEVMFTSGTTGAPKGVQLDHAQLMRAYWAWTGLGGLEPGDNYLVITPFSHGFGLNAGVIASALRGMCMVLLDIFEPNRALELIRRHRVSVVAGPPNLFARIMDLPGVAEDPPKSPRVAFIGAATVPVEILKRVQSVLGIQRVINAYGLMEACVVSQTRADDDRDVISTTTGRALPDVEVRIVDDAGNDLPDGETGEILVRSYGIMKGYWQDERQTRESMTDDGFFRTGDIGVRDDRGNIRIVDRKKDMFICGGFNAYPAEIEDLLLRMGGISAVSVVGVPDAERGEVPVAYVVPASGSGIDADRVVAWARANLASYKVPRRVYLREALPLNGNGKVMKDVLRRDAIEDRLSG
jgi:acyl-CoA synthetase (AMP-forming)/AMP-acid ligase II